MPFDHATIVIFLNYDFVYLNGKVLKYRLIIIRLAPKFVRFLAGKKTTYQSNNEM